MGKSRIQGLDSSDVNLGMISMDADFGTFPHTENEMSGCFLCIYMYVRMYVY